MSKQHLERASGKTYEAAAQASGYSSCWMFAKTMKQQLAAQGNTYIFPCVRWLLSFLKLICFNGQFDETQSEGELEHLGAPILA